MPTGQGFAAMAGIGKESAYGTNVAVDEILPFTSEELNRSIAKIMQEYLDNTPAHRDAQNSVITVNNALSTQGIYDEKDAGGDILGQGLLFLLLLGSATWDGVNSVNKFQVASNPAASATIAINKAVSVWETVSAMINSMEMSANHQGVSFNWSIIAQNLLRTGDSGIVNAAAAITGLSVDAIPVKMSLEHAVFRIGVLGAPLDGNDAFKISEFNLNYGNNLSESTFTTTDSTHTDGTLTIQPVRNGRVETMLNFTLPRYESNQFYSWLNANTQLQADLVFTDPVNSKSISFLFPHIKIINPSSPTPDASVFPLTVECQCFDNKDGVINSDMTFTDGDDITYQMGIETSDGRTVAP